MTDDIVARLRFEYVSCECSGIRHDCDRCEVEHEAADEIERLLAENKKWKSIASNFYYKRDNAAKQYEKEVRNGNR
jgi:hypothetical protein